MANNRPLERTTQARLMVAALAVGVGTVACSTEESHLEISAYLAASGPIPDLEVTALPFDLTRILDSLSSASPTPRPLFDDLEAEMSVYSRPEVEQLREIGTAWRITRDSVKALADSLNRVSPESPGYGQAYERLRQQYRRLAQRAVERDREFRDQVGEDRELALRATTAADSLRAWERTAYADLPVLADSALANSGRSIVTGVSDEHGHLELHLAPGHWWLVARLPDLHNPFMETVWNVPIVVTALGPFKIPLDDETSATQWRH